MKSVFLLAGAAGLMLGLVATATHVAAGQSQPSGQSGSQQVTLVPNAKIAELLKTKGGPLLTADDYKVSVSRREGPGEVEWHERDSDVFYVIEGTATVVTGGTMQEPRTTGPGEQRATSIAGGETRTLSKGDVIVIPRGVPHWFKAIPQAPFLYFVVKSVASEGAK